MVSQLTASIPPSFPMPPRNGLAGMGLTAGAGTDGVGTGGVGTGGAGTGGAGTAARGLAARGLAAGVGTDGVALAGLPGLNGGEILRPPDHARRMTVTVAGRT